MDFDLEKEAATAAINLVSKRVLTPNGDYMIAEPRTPTLQEIASEIKRVALAYKVAVINDVCQEASKPVRKRRKRIRKLE